MHEFRQLVSSSAFSDLDRHFAAFIEGQAGGDSPSLALAAALVSYSRSEGHICLDLEELAGTVFPDKPVDGVKAVPLPSLKAWVRELKASPVVGAAGEFKPLTLDARHRLYLHRYWEYEQSLAAEILKRAGDQPREPHDAELDRRLQALMPAESGETPNWQRVAAATAASRKFCVIAGGPGTGKTHTLVVILALLLELEPGRKLRIAVAAPTGKAATRIQDSIRSAKAVLACSEAIKAQLPERAMTLHRLLGYIPDSAYFRHNADNPLPYDVIAVDEASMVDLALMAKLFQAIPPSARVILLGDKDQLASVEAGAVLGDICSAGGAKGSAALADCVVHLKKNYRFGEQSAIHRLSNAINDGRIEAALQIIQDSSRDPASDLVATTLPRRSDLKEALRGPVTAGFGEFLKASDPLEALSALARFRVLCALREGPFGVTGLNQLIEELLVEAALIQPLGPLVCPPADHESPATITTSSSSTATSASSCPTPPAANRGPSSRGRTMACASSCRCACRSTKPPTP